MKDSGITRIHQQMHLGHGAELGIPNHVKASLSCDCNFLSFFLFLLHKTTTL